MVTPKVLQGRVLAGVSDLRSVPVVDPSSDCCRGVAHGEVVAFEHDLLPGGGKESFPAALELERVVVLAEDGEQWTVGQWSTQGGVDGGVEAVGAAGVGQVP